MRNYDIGFFSSADRGLDTLLTLIPKIEDKLGRPVTSCWAYGWDTFDQFHAKNPEKMKWKWNIIRSMSQIGMESKGRLTHEELAKVMQDTKVWCYPTDFTEIFCITAVKAQAAECDVVTSGLAALQETVLKDEEEITDISTKPEELDKFVDRVVEALQKRDDKALAKTKEEAIKAHEWSVMAEIWDRELA